jgi:hypothetical protein
MGGYFRLEKTSEAIEAQGDFRARGAASQDGLAAQVESIGDECRHPMMAIFQVGAFGGPAHQPRPQAERFPPEGNSRVCLVQC